MPQRNPPRPSAWPRRLLIFGACVILILMIVAFTAMNSQDFTLAFPLMVAIVVMMVFEMVCVAWMNRQGR
ncbi:MAG TPA: hypothetical protein VGE07_15960 [Herpetosiphonaceae bacterium]